MEYKSGFEKLDLPEYFKFGIELEAYNVETKGKNGLYENKESENYIINKNWHMAKKREEKLVAEGGAELVSPILKDTPEDWKDISDMCNHMKKYPGKKGTSVVADEKCGLHIHFDADCIRKDEDIMRNFKRLYAESEELIYKMCNDKNDPLRKGAINRNLKGVSIVSSIWRKGMASPSGEKILQQIKDGTLKVSYKNFGIIRENIVCKFKLDERRYHGLNLTNTGSTKKNTIEFRMANGTLNPEVIKQNVFLYSSIINTSIEMTKNPEKYANKLNEFYKTDVTEQQKVENFLNLIMDKPENRNIFYERWKSVKDNKVFDENDVKGFSLNRFKREEFKNIAYEVAPNEIKETYAQIKESITNEKGEVSYDERN